MTIEEKELLEPIIRSIMEKTKGHATDAEVAKALELLDTMAASESMYTYEHPDYKAMVKDVPGVLRQLLDDSGDHDGLIEYEDMAAECSQMERGALADAVSSIIYFWMDKWHSAGDGDDDDDDDDGVWLYPIHVAIAMAEHFKLRECLPALLEIERQDHDFAVAFFDEHDLAGMAGACIYQVVTADDLPMLADFVRERGIYTFAKAEVVAAGATLPRRELASLPQVQQWLCEVLGIFADGIDPEVGDVTLLEAIIHCCIHARCEAAKPMIIGMYCKYKLPNILIPGGVNEVRRSIKRADIGVLADDRQSAEALLMNAHSFYDEDEYDEDEYDEYDEYDDEADEEYDEEERDDGEDELAPCQEYCGWTYGGTARYLPVKSMQKYTLRIELRGSEPLVWRELEVPSSISLASLAQAILLAMGWDEDHLHQFIGKRGEYYATSLNQPDFPFAQDDKDGTRYAISRLLKKEGDTTLFEYDYGDSWTHVVKLEAMADYGSGEERVVRLTGGANACPPDDCGGIYRYNHLVQLIKQKPRSRELREFYDWMGSKWSPTFFPLKEAAEAVDGMN